MAGKKRSLMAKNEARERAEAAASTLGGLSGRARDAALERKRKLKRELEAIERELG